ncbi:MAG: type VI secretion system amidase effector protein Tae4 [Azoarcus sp.]|jgi:hypothetical protein|nr:type VI secretion system amidase effector protein Tae4 [Azoarcus sp.]
MKPVFSTLKKNHYSSDENSPDYKGKTDVYNEIGYDFGKLVAQNGQYGNTCAVRMSLALLKSNVNFGHPISRLVIKSGPYKGRFVGTGAKTLADALASPTVLGKPLTGEKAKDAIETKRGIVLFYDWPGYSRGGHIDLIEPGSICHSSCFFKEGLKELWFWPLD